MMMRRSIIILINLSLGLFTAYMLVVHIRETNISTHQGHIACTILKLDQEYTSRQHPTADIIYQNKQYTTNISVGNSLQIGYNNDTFYYDELLDRVFCHDPGIEKGLYVAIFLFISSFLFWLNPNTVFKNERKRK